MFISFAGRVWDAITDPIVGLLVDRFEFGRFGKFRPWCARVPSAAFHLFLQTTPNDAYRLMSLSGSRALSHLAV